MRFYLDNDVDHDCRAVIERHGHECWTTSDAGRYRADDDDQAFYAAERGAVMVTHDREFTERRKRNTIGQHIRLCVDHPDGPRFLDLFLEEACEILAARADVVIEIRFSGVTDFCSWS